MIGRLLVIGTLLWASRASAGAGAPEVDPAVEAVRVKVVRCFNSNDAKGLFDLYDPEMKAAFPLDKVVSFVNGAHEVMGEVQSVKALKGGKRSASYQLLAQKGEWLMEIHLDGTGGISGFKLTRPPPPPPPVASNDIPLGLPFRGRWTVFWGGDNLEVNRHASDNSQRRAADLVGVGEDARTSRPPGKTNEDFLAWGREVLAVADGEVVTVVDGVPENSPGTVNPYMATGNVIVVRHGPRLYSAYAHLQPGSPKVKAGAKVKRGDVIGLCGNSGNSSEPHLHFQLMDGPRFESAWGVEAVFRDVRVERDGKKSIPAQYRFLKGDVIELAGRATGAE